jgi:hypothetical protein
MRIMDGRGVEYEVTYDAQREVYVYMKVFKPSEEPHATRDLSPFGPQHQVQAGQYR